MKKTLLAALLAASVTSVKANDIFATGTIPYELDSQEYVNFIQSFTTQDYIMQIGSPFGATTLNFTIDLPNPEQYRINFMDRWGNVYGSVKPDNQGLAIIPYEVTGKDIEDDSLLGFDENFNQYIDAYLLIRKDGDENSLPKIYSIEEGFIDLRFINSKEITLSSLDQLVAYVDDGRDTDKDGTKDVEELVLGTDPNNMSSKFSANLIYNPSNNSTQLSFNGKCGITYDIYDSTTLASNNWQLIDSVTPQIDELVTRSYSMVGYDKRFFKVHTNAQR